MKYSKKETDFLVYCLESYKEKMELTGREAAEIFRRTKADEYVLRNYEALHTAGLEYIMDDIDGFIKEKIAGSSGINSMKN